ncbi:MAG: NADH-quinone oxidoreductase subunit NuoI [Armatimonadota bacterium]
MIVELLKGLGITLKHVIRKPNTVNYPEEMRPTSPRARWRHKLLRHDNGLERCIGCALCAGACPSNCINVVAANNTDVDRKSPGERYAAVYEINILRCIFCGYCEDACPTGAIVLGTDFELADYDRATFVYGKDRLLVSEPGEVARVKK